MKACLRFLLLSLLVGWAVALLANVTVRVSRKRLAVGDTVMLVVTLSGPGIEKLPLPELFPSSFEEITRSDHPMLFQDAFGNTVFGRTVSIHLKALSGGRFRLGAFSVNHNGILYRSSGELVEVEGPVGAAASEPAKPLPAEIKPEMKPSIDVRLSAEIDKRRVYVGERITYSIRITHNSTQVREIKLLKMPQFANFWNEEVELDRHVSPPKQVKIAGSDYISQSIPRFWLYPAVSGTLTIPALTYSMLADGKSFTIKTAPLSVEVLPLPESGRPSSFRGAVGRYTMRVSLADSVGRVGVPLRLAVEIETESGNIDALTPPSMPEISGAKVYGLTRVKRVQQSRYGAADRLARWEAEIVPTSAGMLSVPEIEFSYFEPEVKAYKTIRSTPLSIEIAPAGMPTILEDRNFGTSELAAERVAVFIQLVKYPFLGLVAATCLAISVVAVRRGLSKLSRRRQEVQTKALALLREREELRRLVNSSYGKLSRSDEKAYATTLLMVIRRLSELLAGSQNFEGLVAHLKARGCEAAFIKNLTDLYEECERIRFAPLTNRSADKETNYYRFKQARELLGKVIDLIN
ncbi:MAG: BatD family protein [Acidobacteriota bacterium]|nr:BatD family protein [Blastocatellia bacterium]MDW8412851.1 BatD family protein [Acidobacteriota bacterium]